VETLLVAGLVVLALGLIVLRHRVTMKAIRENPRPRLPIYVLVPLLLLIAGLMVYRLSH
jgi:uncharacterized membrane protein YidH (DUF202 family)